MSELLLGRYEVLEEAGSGGFASVLVAWDTRIQRKVAIKCMPLSGAPLDSLMNNQAQYEGVGGSDASDDSDDAGASDDSPGSQSILVANSALDASVIPGLEEARTAAMLNDANIVSVYDFEIKGDTAYLILEYIEGITLGELLAHYSDEVTPDVIAAVFKAVSHALEVAHKNKVLHLDIKPDNVLIDKQGQVKVVDFGLARLAGEYGFGTAEGGTIGYMPLEQMRQEPLDERCDEWALASLLYEMISGDNPFLAPTLQKAEKKIEGAELFVPSMYLEDADESIDDIMFCALDPDKENRYDSVADFAHEMKQCLGDPRKGKRQLAHIVGSLETEEDDEEDFEDEEGVMGRSFEGFSPRVLTIAMRLWSALAVSFTAFIGVANAPFINGGWSSPISWVVLAGAFVLGAVIPSIAGALALIFVGVIFFIHEAYIVAIIFIALACAWWFVSGRNSLKEALVVISTPILGAIGLAPLAILLAGLELRMKNALIATVFSALVSFMLAGLGSGSILGWDALLCLQVKGPDALNAALLTSLQDVQCWTMFASWLLSVVVLCLCSKSKTLWSPCLGLVISVALLAIALVAGMYLYTNGATCTPLPVNVASVVLSGILAFLYLLFDRRLVSHDQARA